MCAFESAGGVGDEAFVSMGGGYESSCRKNWLELITECPYCGVMRVPQNTWNNIDKPTIRCINKRGCVGRKERKTRKWTPDKW